MLPSIYIYGLGKDDWALIFAGASFIIALITLLYTWHHDSKEIKKNNEVLSNTLRLDFSKRYQDLMTAMPVTIEFSDKYAGLYIDLCAEEYRLWSQDKDLVDEETWNLWKEGMGYMLESHPELYIYWQEHRHYYDTRMQHEKISFQFFFDKLIERYSK